MPTFNALVKFDLTEKLPRTVFLFLLGNIIGKIWKQFCFNFTFIMDPQL